MARGGERGEGGGGGRLGRAGAVPEQQRDGVRGADLSGQRRGGEADVVPRVDVRAPLDQQRGHRVVGHRAGEQQGGPPAVVPVA